MRLAILPTIFSLWLAAAHFLYVKDPGLFALMLLAPALLFWRRGWIPKLFRFLNLGLALLWIWVARGYLSYRIQYDQPYLRLVLILSLLALFSCWAAWLLKHRSFKETYPQGPNDTAAAWAAILSFVFLAFIQWKVQRPMLIAERLAPGMGWFQIAALSLYAGALTQAMATPRGSRKWRPRIWLIFSIVFFSQLALGLLGLEDFLMTGKLHAPVPALIAAGPVFRGEGFFMPILFLSTIALVGPAWCSYLCYFGAWDFFAAKKGPRRPQRLPRWAPWARAGILILVVGVAWTLARMGVSGWAASMLGIAFGLVGLALILSLSRKTGVMTHCVVYCPIGLLANTLGKLSPFRIVIDSKCSLCGACGPACRYDALRKEHLKGGKAGLNCSLCGDCISACKTQEISLKFGPWQGAQVRSTFLVLIITLHVVFLGVARI